MEQRFIASMVLSGVGDAMGYHRGAWEFNRSGPEIHAHMMRLTNNRGVLHLGICGSDWIVSDDTVMHIATAEALVQVNEVVGDSLFEKIAERYVACGEDMMSRAPGMSCMTGIARMKRLGVKTWNQAGFSEHAAGCGAAMRSMCIGLRFHRPEQLKDLVRVAVESGRMTHHSGTGYLGAVASALFTAYAIQGVPVSDWGWMLLEQGVPTAQQVITEAGREVEKNLASFDYFIKRWKEYLAIRGIAGAGHAAVVFPSDWNDVEVRDQFYDKLSFSGWGGASGHDAPQIAYDALLWSGSNWEKLCLSGILHGGDNDSTGCIAGAWWGALYGLQSVPPCHWKGVEYAERLATLGSQLYKLYFSSN